MSRRSARVFFGALLAVLSTVAHAQTPPTLVYSNDVLGDIEPCGCRNNPLGGYIRKSKFLESLKGSELLQVDAGDLFFNSSDIPEILKEQSQKQAEKHAQILKLLNHQILVPGEKDFALGVKTYKNLVKISGSRVLAANIKNSSGNLVFSGSQIFTFHAKTPQSFKVAVLGLVSPSLSWPKELRISDPVEVALVEVARLKKLANWVIVVTHQGLEDDQKLAEAVKDIDIIVGAHSQSFLQSPTLVNQTQILQSSFRNQYIGVFKLERTTDPLRHKLVAQDIEFASSPEDRIKKSRTAKVEIIVNGFRDELAKLEKTRLELAGLDSKEEKFHTFAKCADCHSRQFEFWRKTPHSLALEPLIQKKAVFNKECITCHSLGLGDPQGYRDPAQIATYRKGESSNGEAAYTHLSAPEFAADLKAMHDAMGPDTLIRGVKMSEWLARLKKAWAPVQCESCHSPGRSHPFGGGLYSKHVETATCLGCHRKERAPEWFSADGNPQEDIIAKKKKMIACPAGAPDGAE